MPEPTVPEVVDGYVVEGVLGRGGAGLVLKARDRTLDRWLAIKLLTDDVDPEARARFMIEAKAAARIDHPHVVKVYGVGHHEEQLYITQEWVDGLPLSLMLEARGRLSWEAVADLGLQVASGLAEATHVGVLHRDIKPANLLVTEEGVVKVVDFGVAKLLDTPTQLTEKGTTLGTPHYMSPEQGRGLPLDARSDQYALGATLYHLLTGKPPFDADNTVTLLLKHASHPIVGVQTLASDCPAPLAEIVERMLEKSPGDRYPDFDAIIDALEAVIGEEGDHAELVALRAEVKPEAEGLSKAFRFKAVRWRERLVFAGVGFAAMAVVISALVFGGEGALTTGQAKPMPPPPEAPKIALKVKPPPPSLKTPSSDPRPAKKKPAKASTARLIQQLDAPPSRAVAAAQELGRREDQQATLALIRAAQSSHPQVSIAAAHALGQLGDIRALEPLLALEREGRTKAIRQAAQKARRRLWQVEGEEY